VAFSDAPPFDLFGLSEQPALLLGTDVLKSFKRLSLDFRASMCASSISGMFRRSVAIGSNN
jgi:hypothetical protein